MTNTRSQTPESPKSKSRNWFSLLSIIFGIISMSMVGSVYAIAKNEGVHSTMGQLKSTAILGVMVGVLAVILGIVGFKQSSRLNRGKFAAIIGIFFGVGGPFQIITEFPNLVLMSHLYKVKYDFKQISSMLEQYRANGGIFPSTMQGLRVLITEPSGSPRPKSWKQISAVLPKDPWGNEYSYRFPGKRYVNTFEIMSNGPDGRSYTPDDISSQDLSQ